MQLPYLIEERRSQETNVFSCRHRYRKYSLRKTKNLREAELRYGNNKEKGRTVHTYLQNSLCFVSLDIIFLQY